MTTPYFENERCTIYHGDALDVLPKLSGVGAVVTDPPYSSGGAFRSDRTMSTVSKYVQSGSDRSKTIQEFTGDSRDQRSYLAWSSLWLCAAFNAAEAGAPVMCFSDWRQLPTTTDALQAGGWSWRGIAVWSKKFGRPFPGRFSSACEYVAWGSKGPMPEREGAVAGVFECSSPRDKKHIAQKPLEVMSWLLRIVPEGATVLDPFMGSGTTLRAAMDNGLRCIGIEADESFCELAATRLAQGVLF